MYHPHFFCTRKTKCVLMASVVAATQGCQPSQATKKLEAKNWRSRVSSLFYAIYHERDGLDGRACYLNVHSRAAFEPENKTR